DTQAGSLQSATPLQSLSAASVQTSASDGLTFGLRSLQSVPPQATSMKVSPSASLPSKTQKPSMHRSVVQKSKSLQSKSTTQPGGPPPPPSPPPPWPPGPWPPGPCAPG